MKHSPEIELAAAKRDLDSAESDCPHWDYSGEHQHMGDECCYRVADAKRRLRLARKAAA